MIYYACRPRRIFVVAEKHQAGYDPICGYPLGSTCPIMRVK
jgi:hypothetical protein